jgi:large subunit ribosomal protein L1
MGKKKLALVGAEEKKDKNQKKTEEKKTEEREVSVEKTVKETALKKTKKTSEKKDKNQKKKQKPGKRYLNAKKKIKKDKLYSLIDAIKLAQETSITSFEGSIETHFLLKENDIKGEVSFPHSTGKKIKAEIVSEEVLEKIQNGKIDFTALIASPADMPKLAKYAKILGPKGLMPNPKNGTITDNPKEALKKLSATVRFKTEQKAPLLHIVVGKTKQSPQEIYKNIKTLIKEINITKIQKLTLTSTMGPSVSVDLQTI